MDRETLNKAKKIETKIDITTSQLQRTKENEADFLIEINQITCNDPANLMVSHEIIEHIKTEIIFDLENTLKRLEEELEDL